MTASDPPPDDQLLKEAATWFARMRGPEAETYRDEFEAWLRRGALHRQAYNRAAEVFALGKHLRESDGPSPAMKGAGGWRGRKLLVPLAAVLVLAATAWLVLGGAIFPRSGPAPIAERSGGPAGIDRRVATEAGQTRTARLEDGSLVNLGSATRIRVQFDRRERRINLEQGMARFAVAHDTRPLIVHAGGGQVRAVGTLFEVAVAGDGRVTVQLIEGSVEVIPAPDQATPRPAPRRLFPGQSMSFAARSVRPAGNEAPAQPGASSDRTATANGVASEFHNVTLAELVASANRRARRPIHLADPAIGTLRVSGRFRIDDTRLLAERLALLFDLVRTDDENGGIVLRRR